MDTLTILQGVAGGIIFVGLVYAVRSYFEKHGKKAPPRKQYTEEELAEMKRIYEEINALAAELGVEHYVQMWRAQHISEQDILGYLYEMKESRGG